MKPIAVQIAVPVLVVGSMLGLAAVFGESEYCRVYMDLDSRQKYCKTQKFDMHYEYDRPQWYVLMNGPEPSTGLPQDHGTYWKAIPRERSRKNDSVPPMKDPLGMPIAVLIDAADAPRIGHQIPLTQARHEGDVIE